MDVQISTELIAAASHLCGALSFLVLSALLTTAWRGRLQGGLLVGACVVSTVWSFAIASHSLYAMPPHTALLLIELLRGVTWFLFLLRLLGWASQRGAEEPRLGFIPLIVFGLSAALGVLVLSQWTPQALPLAEETRAQATHFGFLVLAVVGLILVEQVFRNTLREHRWAIKFLCFGIGGLFVYDLYLYSNALLFGRIDATLWAARGVINALVVPLVAVSAVRNPDWSVGIFVSRHVVFHTAALLGTGVYLILMAAAGYYIRYYGGSWGAVAQTVFLFGALVLLLVLMFSGQFRARLAVFLGKHFYSNKYDYRQEWLRFTHTLSSGGPPAELKTTIIRAIAEIVESRGGIMWERERSGELRAVAQWQAAIPGRNLMTPEDPLVRFLESHGWVIFLDEFAEQPERYPGLELPECIVNARKPWLIVPLLHGDELVGLVLLTDSSTNRGLNWEDSDLLKTVGRQAASYVALVRANEALTDARQFEAFNRLSAYVVHDLKNLVAQLALVVDNSQRHMDKPGFIDDAIATVDHATKKMNRLLSQLRKGRSQPRMAATVNLNEALAEVVQARISQSPRPTLCACAEELRVFLDRDRLTSVVEHLVQNAQEATPTEGAVTISLSRAGDHALIEVADDGEGMAADFIAERLFRPFDTTKGNAGMGVGVYESREFVLSAGGRLDVASEVGQGTTFSIKLPIETTINSQRSDSQHLEMAS